MTLARSTLRLGGAEPRARRVERLLRRGTCLEETLGAVELRLGLCQLRLGRRGAARAVPRSSRVISVCPAWTLSPAETRTSLT